MPRQTIHQALLRRWLKVADATAITAQKALQRDLAYAKRITQVWRSEVLSLEWEEAKPQAPEAVRDLVLNTNLILNPNKHFQELVFGAEVLKPRGNVWVLVAEAEAGEDLLGTINRRGLLPFSLNQAHWGTLWELDLNDSDPVSLAKEIATTESRHQGLLGNPHIQHIHVLEEPPRASELVALMHQYAARH